MGAIGTTRLSFLRRLRDPDDRLSWVEFHERYGAHMYDCARQNGATHTEAEDIVQDIEMYFFRAIEGFRYSRRRGRFRAYLQVGVARAMRRKLKRRMRGETLVDPRALDTMASSAVATPDGHERRLQILRKAMTVVRSEVDAVTVEAFYRYALAGQAAQETADTLGIGTASVYQAKTRIMKRLRKVIRRLDADA